MNSLLKTVTRQRRDCDLNSGSSAPKSNTLTTRLPTEPPDTRALEAVKTESRTPRRPPTLIDHKVAQR